VRLSYGSLEDYSFLERSISDNAAEVIFHAAGQSDVGLAQKNPRATFEINIRGTWNLLEACRCAAPPVRVLFISSEAVYRNRHTHQPEENRPPQVLSPYAASKLCGEILGRTYFHAYGLPFDTVRYSNLYGGGDSNFSRLIPGTIRSVLRGQPPIIRGNGTPLRDYLYVEDAARAC
jgi:CDP-glucose 4,6-dehydratase